MAKVNNDDGSSEQRKSAPRSAGQGFLLLVVLAMVLMALFVWTQSQDRTEISYDFFESQLAGKNVESLQVVGSKALGKFRTPPELPPDRTKSAQGDAAKPKKAEPYFLVNLPSSLDQQYLLSRLNESGARFSFAPAADPTLYVFLIGMSVTVGLFVVFWIWLRRTQNQMMGGGFLSGFAKSPAKRYEASRQAVTFNDVAGLEGVKADLMEIVDYLKNPKKFQKLGGRVPKGVLLNGPPGTGKTLLARAVAGEAGVPYYSVSGSEFIQMFVGVGASRVRDLFKTAKENSPAIIFVDEIDAVGRQRGAGLGGGHDEREQTLNQILSEMDGFAQNDFVIVLAATNRPDVLDPALLRPGRFDRHITVGRPTQKGRVEIFKVHTRDVPLGDDVNLETLAAGTIGLTGADIRNIVNEAALWAARQDKTRVDMSDFEYARDKVLMGPKREEVMQEKEKEKTAYHEAGHTLLAWTLPGTHRVHKVTIVPRGRALGVTQTLPSEDRMNHSEPELRDNLAFMLGGRAAEKLIYNETSVGAENDLERATSIARRMVMSWGMSEKLGPVSYKIADDDPFLGREIHQQRQFSEATLELIDAEVTRLLHEAADRAFSLLSQMRDKLEALTQALLKQEELDEPEIAAIIGPSVHKGSRKNEPELLVAPPSPSLAPS
jgi:cell division protease FtsH